MRRSISSNSPRHFSATANKSAWRLSRAIRRHSSNKGVRRISWPPTTSRSQSISPSRSNWGNWPTRPVVEANPLFRAARPRMAVDATPPLAPINQTPIRPSSMMVHCRARGGLRQYGREPSPPRGMVAGKPRMADGPIVTATIHRPMFLIGVAVELPPQPKSAHGVCGTHLLPFPPGVGRFGPQSATEKA